MEVHFRNIRNQIINQINSAEKEINIAVAWFTNLDLFTTILNKLSQGVKVNLIIINDYINNGDYGLDFQSFVDNGGSLYYGKQENPMHHKFCIIDDKILINGSYNWTYYAESRNKENVIITNEYTVIQRYSLEFEYMKNSLEKIDTVFKLKFSQISLTDIFSIREYISMDYFLRGKERKEPNLITKAFTIAPNNKEIEKNQYLINSDISKHNKELQQSIGIHVVKGDRDNQYHKMIELNSKVPIESSSNFGINQDFQEFANIKICYGENKLFSQNTQISHFKLRLQPQLRKDAKGKVLTKFKINSIGILTVSVTDTKNQNSMTMEYDISYLIK